MEAASHPLPASAERAPAPTTGLTDRARAERKLAYILCAPAAIVMFAVAGLPIIYAFVLSLQHYDLRFPHSHAFVGLTNYIDVLTASTWWKDVLATVIVTGVSVAIELVLGMLLALVMHRAIFARGMVRAAILIPYGIVTVVSAFTFLYAFQLATGFVPAALGLTTDPLTNSFGSFAVIIITEVWKTTPFMALLLLGGLVLVPDDLYEAAKIDGASAWQRFFRITLPLMRPAILVALLFRALDAFRIFDTPFIQTGGSNGTETVSILGYNTLINRVNIGLGSAVSVLIFGCVILIAIGFIKGLGTSTSTQGDR